MKITTLYDFPEVCQKLCVVSIFLCNILQYGSMHGACNSKHWQTTKVGEQTLIHHKDDFGWSVDNASLASKNGDMRQMSVDLFGKGKLSQGVDNREVTY